MATTTTKPIVFTPSHGDDGEAAGWQQLTRMPWLVRYGSDDFVEVRAERGVRAFVNGFAVIGDPIGLQILEPGDLVRVFEGAGGSISFVYAGQSVQAETVDAGAVCAFTGLPIEGRAVRCPACGSVVGEDVVAQLGQCVCGHALEQRPTG